MKSAGQHFGDSAFKWLTLVMALAVFALIALIGYELFRGSHLALQKFGWHFLVSSDWDPVNDVYGALPFIFGTLVSSAIALIIAVPISIATAVYLTELAPLRVRQPLTMFIELLAAVPSVILGLWGIFVMVPFLQGDAAQTIRFMAAKASRISAAFSWPDLRPVFFVRRHHRRHHDHSHHHVRLARNSTLRSRPATRSRLRARRDTLGSHAHRRFELREKGPVRRGDSRTGPRARRNDGRHDGHRQHAANRQIAFRPATRWPASSRTNSTRPPAICIRARCLKSASCCSA
jgi:hypothetical protein